LGYEKSASENTQLYPEPPEEIAPDVISDQPELLGEDFKLKLKS
jgi:hypothetical protein